MNVSMEQIDKMTDSLTKACADMNMMMRDTMNAYLQSTTIVTKGCEEMCDSVSTLMQKALESNAQAGRAMMNAKNINDIMDIQANMMKNNFDSMMAETNRMSMLSSRIAQEAAGPMTQNMNATITKLSLVKAA